MDVVVCSLDSIGEETICCSCSSKMEEERADRVGRVDCSGGEP